ncbi:MAG: hypothetical protein COA43_00085 [Robiginitomaculum sp.]|nr:MAG: hypothetical protein COA43_00085 [Robiginitomaculum sp.]
MDSNSKQVEAMRAFNFLEGCWRGEKLSPEQDEGAVIGVAIDECRYAFGERVFTISGRGFDVTGEVLEIDNFGVFSFDVDRGEYTLTSHVNGNVGKGHVEVLSEKCIRVFPRGKDGPVRITMLGQGNLNWHETIEQRSMTSGNKPPEIVWIPSFEIKFKAIPTS